jgi:hypothetical protein
MDGVVNNLASSEASIQTQSAKEYPSSLDFMFGVDPPRPPKDGFEWVWFPEGYWAEREFQPKSPEPKIWKWRKSSAKSRNSRLSDPSQVSPKAPPRQASNPPAQTPMSPYLSEQAHVQSLQRPLSPLASRGEKEGEWLATKHRVFHQHIPTPPPPVETERRVTDGRHRFTALP